MRPTSEYLWFLKNLPPDLINLGGTTPHVPEFVHSWKNEISEPFSVDNIPALNELKTVISEKTSWTKENIHITPGVTEGIFGLLAMLTNPGDRVLLSSPYYEPFVAAGNFLGLQIDYFDPQTAGLDEKFYTPYKMILITNPNCFTGLTIDDFILKLSHLTSASIVVDEIYRPFSDEGKITFLKKDRPSNVISVGGLSKPTGITNLRIGWVLGSASIIESLKKFDLFIHTDMPRITIKSASNVMKHWSQIVNYHRADFEIKRQALSPHLKLMGLDIKSRHFFDVSLPKKFSSEKDFTKALKEKYNFYITEGSFFGAPGRLRISLTGNLAHLKQLLEILEKDLL